VQAANFTMTGSNVSITAPCAAEGFRLYSPATFSVQWVTRASELSASSGVPTGQAVGAAITAEEISSTDYAVEIVAPRGNPFIAGEAIALAVGGSNVVAVRPIRPGGS
jgi:hypothetical protein